MPDAEVHVFSDSVSCLEKGVMNEPDIKFTKGWTGYLEQYRKSARLIDGEKIQFVFHILPGKKAKEIAREISECIRQGQGKDAQNFTPEM